jgi:DNA polymerase/3'-5' exonuclease PolX
VKYKAHYVLQNESILLTAIFSCLISTDGIGKGSSDKIYEYLDTGKIKKLEEKRKLHA